MRAGDASSSSLALPKTSSLFVAKACLPMLQTRHLKNSSPCLHIAVILAKHVIVLAGPFHSLKHICLHWLHSLGSQSTISYIHGGHYYTWVALFLPSLPVADFVEASFDHLRNRSSVIFSKEKHGQQHALWPLCVSKLLSMIDYVQRSHGGIGIPRSKTILVCSTKSISTICRNISSSSTQNTCFA